MNLRLSRLVPSLAFTTSFAIAQVQLPPAEPGVKIADPFVKLDTLVVSATRTEKPLIEVPASVSVVSLKDRENKGLLRIGEELVGVPGVTLRQEQSGVEAALVIRGAPERHLNDTFLLLLDGVPFVTPDDEVLLESVPYGAVDRVEVVRGPVSALYGRGGVSGAVAYSTREVGDQAAGELTLSYGSNNYFAPSLVYGTPVSDTNRLLVRLGHERGDGWRDRTARRSSSAFLKDVWQVTPKLELTLSGSYSDTEQQIASHLPLRADGSIVAVTGGREANTNIDDARSERTLWFGTARAKLAVSDAVEATFTLHHRDNDSLYNGGFNEGFDEVAETIRWNGFRGDGSDQTTFAEAQVSWKTARNHLLVGANHEWIASQDRETWTGQYGFDFATFDFYFYNQFRSYRTGALLNKADWIQDRLLDADTDVKVGALFVQDEFKATDRLTLTVGARLDRFERDVAFGPTTEENGTVTLPGSRKADSDDNLSPKFSALYQWTPQLSTYFAYGEGFSPAFGPVWSFGGRDTTLKPETARNFEVGVKGEFFDRALGLTATVYRLERQDLLQYVADGVATKTINAGKQRAEGLELQARFDLRAVAEGLSGFASYTYTDAKWIKNRFIVDEFTGEEIDLSGKSVVRVPKHQFSFGLTKNLPAAGLALSAWYDYVGDYPVDGLNQLVDGAHGLANISLTWRPKQASQWEWSVVVRNAFDKEYNLLRGTSREPVEAYPGAPRQFLTTLRYAF
ncbi:Ferrichrome-iron receptor precursor [Lacunisphaera limnophila]|uniref:Ferrichrome-iron receptor n=1 Tax=Lacunisphaera limnophila TaxID=1838286 RepID=A0A1D8ASG0_9BACT|nr:TonB-dependent receptor [Lacunisphaera limnophila]AOS43833.1 Ferrichrome-iron receptor precursor [Lacunisphaera limnophila]